MPLVLGRGTPAGPKRTGIYCSEMNSGALERLTDMSRKVVLKMVVSLDGFATSPDGTHDWMFEWFGEDSAEWNHRALGEAGVHAMGRRSYEIMGPHWAASEGPIATAMNEK